MGIRSKLREKIIQKKLKQCGENVYIQKPICMDYGSIILGNNIHILKDSRIQNVSGDSNVVIEIGNNTGIQYRFSILAGADVFIGNNVAIASDVFISAGNHGMDPECKVPYGCQKYIGKSVVIDDDVWIGEKVIILSGVNIGKGAIVGGGTIVTKNIPPYCIAVGNPARVIKRYDFILHKWISIS